jgi:hypothetical protein
MSLEKSDLHNYFKMHFHKFYWPGEREGGGEVSPTSLDNFGTQWYGDLGPESWRRDKIACHFASDFVAAPSSHCSRFPHRMRLRPFILHMQRALSKPTVVMTQRNCGDVAPSQCQGKVLKCSYTLVQKSKAGTLHGVNVRRRHLKISTIQTDTYEKPVSVIQKCRNLYYVERSTGIRQAFRKQFL